MMVGYRSFVYTILCLFLVILVQGATKLILPIYENSESADISFQESSQHGSTLKRVKRNLFQFSAMIQFATKREALLYNRYGNHCGYNWEPTNATAVDEVDKCCYVHDRCYSKAFSGVCEKRKWSSLISYSWQIADSEIKCTGKTSCTRLVCECDKWAANCFAEHPYKAVYKKPSLLDMFITPEIRRSL